jgi:DNA-binding XRE family transcriptional regulator
VCPLPLPIVPAHYDAHVRALRRRMRLTQDALARRIGAASKAVMYQWESRKRTPSPVLWARIETLSRTNADARRAPTSSKGSSDLVPSELSVR